MGARFGNGVTYYMRFIKWILSQTTTSWASNIGTALPEPPASKYTNKYAHFEIRRNHQQNEFSITWQRRPIPISSCRLSTQEVKRLSSCSSATSQSTLINLATIYIASQIWSAASPLGNSQHSPSSAIVPRPFRNMLPEPSWAPSESSSRYCTRTRPPAHNWAFFWPI